MSTIRSAHSHVPLFHTAMYLQEDAVDYKSIAQFIPAARRI